MHVHYPDIDLGYLDRTTSPHIHSRPAISTKPTNQVSSKSDAPRDIRWEDFAAVVDANVSVWQSVVSSSERIM